MAEDKRRKGTPASRPRARRSPADRGGQSGPKYNGIGVDTGGDIRRPRARRAPAPVTAEIGRVEPRKVKEKRRFLYGIIGGKKIETVKLKGERFPWQVIVVAVACTAIVMALVFDYVKINELTNRYSEQQDEMIELISKRKMLNLTLERKNDLLDFEQKAQELGMIKSDKIEKRYISTEREEKIEVPGGEKNGVGDHIKDFFYKVGDYFRNIFS